jgi:hypothetical protein
VLGGANCDHKLYIVLSDRGVAFTVRGRGVGGG